MSSRLNKLKDKRERLNKAGEMEAKVILGSSNVSSDDLVVHAKKESISAQTTPNDNSTESIQPIAEKAQPKQVSSNRYETKNGTIQYKGSYLSIFIDSESLSMIDQIIEHIDVPKNKTRPHVIKVLVSYDFNIELSEKKKDLLTDLLGTKSKDGINLQVPKAVALAFREKFNEPERLKKALEHVLGSIRKSE